MWLATAKRLYIPDLFSVFGCLEKQIWTWNFTEEEFLPKLGADIHETYLQLTGIFTCLWYYLLVNSELSRTTRNEMQTEDISHLFFWRWAEGVSGRLWKKYKQCEAIFGKQ